MKDIKDIKSIKNVEEIKCHCCGVCCEILSISSLNKPANTRCDNLLDDGRCGNYEGRATVCIEYKADELCYLISSLSDEDKIKVFKAVYGE